MSAKIPDARWINTLLRLVLIINSAGVIQAQSMYCEKSVHTFSLAYRGDFKVTLVDAESLVVLYFVHQCEALKLT